ncbi:MAG: hypothetical protein IJM37_00550 [Lachnospiraceae bacterium]|nr:hypothetical protein [Lachnospiraceae bacterium]
MFKTIRDNFQNSICLDRIKYVIFIGLILVLCFINACGYNKDKPDEKKKFATLEQIEFGNIEYNPDTDIDNSYRYLNDYCASSEGCYFFKMNLNLKDILTFVDNHGKNIVPVCSKADCLHDSKDCDAVFDEFVLGIGWYDGSIYTILAEQTYDEGRFAFFLYKISDNGSSREKVFELYLSDPDPVAPFFYIHRGYIYYTVVSGERTLLYKRSLKGDAPELVYEVNGISSDLINIKGYGDGVLFACMQEDTHYKIIYYSIKNDSLYELVSKTGFSYAISEDSIAYIDGSSMYKMSLSDFNKAVIAENLNESLEIMSDGKKIYVDNLSMVNSGKNKTRKIDIYSFEGKLEDSITLDDVYAEFEVGNGDYILIEFSDRSIKTLDKSQIGTGNHDMKVIYSE